MLSSGNAIKQFLFIDNKNLLEERNNFLKKKFSAAVLAAQNVFVTDDILKIEKITVKGRKDNA